MNPNSPEQPPQPAAYPPPPVAPPPGPLPDAPSPLGLIAAGAGLLLLCVSILLPRVSIEYEGEGTYGYYGLPGIYSAEVFAIDTASVVLSVALLLTVGLSALRAPAMRWPSRLGAIGLAALTAAFAYHPITVAQQYFDVWEANESEYASDPVPEVVIQADNGLYIAVLGLALLAASTFFMRAHRRPMPHYLPPEPPPAQGNTTVSVTPG